jgi:AcrR family transcriptional regulator
MKIPTLTARGRRTRGAILAAAAELFHRKGVHATSVDDILIASATGKGQFYHLFDSKEALVRAVLRDQAERFFDLRVPAPEGLGSWEGIRDWFDAIVALHERRGCPGCPFAMLASEMAEHDPELRRQLAGFFDRWCEHLARGLAALADAGRLRPDADPEALSRFALAALQGGVLLAKTYKDVAPLRLALDEVLRHLQSFDPHADRGESAPGRTR